MTGPADPDARAKLLAAIPHDRFERAHLIWQRFGMYAATTVSANWLPAMAAAGEIERADLPFGNGSAAHYRRKS